MGCHERRLPLAGAHFERGAIRLPTYAVATVRALVRRASARTGGGVRAAGVDEARRTPQAVPAARVRRLEPAYGSRHDNRALGGAPHVAPRGGHIGGRTISQSIAPL